MLFLTLALIYLHTSTRRQVNKLKFVFEFVSLLLSIMKAKTFYLLFTIYYFGHIISNASGTKDPMSKELLIDGRIVGDKIVGGEEASKGEFPWVVGIWRMKSLRPFCGGSLLNNRFVYF